jgi:hypothetical protein
MAPSFSPAADGSKVGGRSLGWRPLRPSEQRARQQEREAQAPQAAIRGHGSVATAGRARIDPHVKPVVLQQETDPLKNPFSDQMPRSPFNGGAPSAAPAQIDEAPGATAPGPADGATKSEPPPPNPFNTAPSQPESTQEPGPLPGATAPGAAAPESGFEIEPLDLDPQKPDPKKDCQEALNNLRTNRLTLARSRAILDLRPQESGAFPYECTLASERLPLDSGRSWPQTCYTWKASGLCHKPLYFEQPHMERHGHSWGPVLDTVISGAHFFASYIEPWPWSIRGGALQATAVTGLVFAVP